MSFSSPVYLDHAATSPLHPAAQQALMGAWEKVGNPNSLHSAGRAARLHLEDAREQVAASLGAHPSEVIFTASGTEADNTALKGLFWAARAQAEKDGRAVPNRILLTGIEHHAVLDAAEWLERHEGAVLEFADVLPDGTVDLSHARSLLEAHPDGFALATLMWANNEVGTIEPVAEFASLCGEFSVPVHTDAVQAWLSAPVDFGASGCATLAVSGHKIGAPVGIGVLLVRRDVKLEPILHGGGQERGIRSGTLNVPMAQALAAVVQARTPSLEQERQHLRQLSERLIEAVLEQIPHAVLNGPDPREDPKRRLPQTVNFSFPGTEGDSLLFLLDIAGFSTSTGSACTAGVAQPSHVVLAMHRSEQLARGTQRFSLSPSTTSEQIEALIAVLPGIVERARKAGLADRAPEMDTPNTIR